MSHPESPGTPLPETQPKSGPAPRVLFGTFTGVFTPTVLTILGVIMYVRLGWVVGNTGLAGAWILMGLALGITACTGLSLSSIATNTRVGAGGPYAMITKALGFEVGGSIGIPLYLTRPLGVAMYIFGFREGWQWIFPHHDALIVDLVVYVVIFVLAYVSANLAFRVQFLIMAVIAASLVSIVASPDAWSGNTDVTWWGDYRGFPEDGFQGADFWLVFAVFFPATTGVLAGANMSGDLANPRRSIASGTIWALIVSTIIYFAMAWIAARIGTPDELTSNYTLLIDRAFWGPAVLGGLLGATFSSALAGAVGGPRILMAMADNNLLPRSKWLAARSSKGEPRNAVALTAVLTLGCLLVRDLNVIAPLVTMFFLITYCVINVVLVVEDSLKLVSFRPSLRVPFWVPLLGTVGSIFAMFVVNAMFGLIAVGCVVALYWYMAHRGVPTHGEDMRSSIFAAVAEWAASRTVRLMGGSYNPRAWKPSLLVPVEDPARLRGEYEFLYDLVSPEGAIKLLGLTTERPRELLEPQMDSLTDSFLKDDLLCSSAVIEADEYVEGIGYGLQALQSAFFRPNILFITLPEPDDERDDSAAKVVMRAHETEVGVMVLGIHPRAGYGQKRIINIWLNRSRSGWDIDEAFQMNNLDLSLLVGYRLMRSWDVTDKLHILTAVEDTAERAEAAGFLADICEQARIPQSATRHVLEGSFEDALQRAPQADLHILGMQTRPDFERMRQIVELADATCLFVEDSGRESARA